MRNIHLIGYRCSGKTAVGRQLAEVLARSFFDADAVFSERAALSITDFVAESGWSAFRRLESQILSELARKEKIILATGGGVVLNPENRRLLKAGGINFWLQVKPETVFARLTADAMSAVQRPALSSLNLKEEIELGLKEREPFYREVADYTVAVDDLTAAEIAGRISALLRAGCKRGSERRPPGCGGCFRT